jgi:4-hydroxy-2-oxoheptanedioate aldolase
VGSPANMRELIAMGYQFLSVGADVVGLWQYFSGIASEFIKRESEWHGNS